MKFLRWLLCISWGLYSENVKIRQGVDFVGEKSKLQYSGKAGDWNTSWNIVLGNIDVEFTFAHSTQ